VAGAWRLFSVPNMPLVAETSPGIQAKGKTMQAVTHNGSAEYRVAQALEEEVVKRAPRVSLHLGLELFFAVLLLGLLIWKVWPK